MKNRTAALVLALCLVGSFSLAQSVTDAPLVVSDPYATNAQPDLRASTVKSHSERKKNTCPPQQTARNKDQRQEAQQSGQNRLQAEMPPTL